MSFKVGTAGIPDSLKRPAGTANGVKQVKKLGLAAMEIEFVRQIYLSENDAKEVKKVAEENDIALTMHAPYYINLNSKDPDKRAASRARIIKSAKIGAIAGASSVAFHPASLLKMPSETVYKIVKAEIKSILNSIPKSIRISPETAGKQGNFGSWKEIIDLAYELGCGACMDFSHIWARSEGKVNFSEVIKYYKDKIGNVKDMHIHMSGIVFTSKGEKNHTSFQNSEFPLNKVLQTLVKYGCGGVIICENPINDEGALHIQKTLQRL